ncbi:MAG: ABC transporter ATP-binding protein [Candidatus Omnitrophica bacterium]|nr:ABC transporter ATP-binding protein [Candidatus Omnitrophota bacterium]
MMNLVLQAVEFSYPSVPVLKGVSLGLKSGEMLAIAGRNGSGKSTLIRCMNRILKCRRGHIVLCGEEVKNLRRMDIARKMAYHPQKTSYNFPITVFEAVLMGRYPHSEWDGDKDGEGHVHEALKMLGIEDLALRDFNEISGGQQQKVVIARAIAQEAKILLLDEPTSDLDIRCQLEVMDTIRRLVKERGISAVVAIHDLNLASRYCDRIVMLNKGVICGAGTPREVLTPENIASVYGVDASVHESGGILHIIPRKPIQ